MKKQVIKTGLFILFLTGTLFLNSHIGLAQTSEPAPIIPSGIEESERLLLPHSSEDNQERALTQDLLPGITRTAIAAAGALALLFVIIGGIQMLTAYGNDEKITQAKKTMTFALVGLVIAILSYAIVSIISAIDISPGQ